jgi:hypothetical protein
MTISRKQLTEAFEAGIDAGKFRGKEEAKKELLAQRQLGIVEISRAVADLALANAKLTYALSRITDKLL